MNVFVTAALADLHQQLRRFYSEIGRPSVDPELMIRMLIVGYRYSWPRWRMKLVYKTRWTAAAVSAMTQMADNLIASRRR